MNRLMLTAALLAAGGAFASQPYCKKWVPYDAGTPDSGNQQKIELTADGGEDAGAQSPYSQPRMVCADYGYADQSGCSASGAVPLAALALLLARRRQIPSPSGRGSG